jgi:hypothetical protein
MSILYIKNDELLKLEKMKIAHTKKCKLRFSKKRYNHYNKENISQFFNSLKVSYSDILYEVRFKISFSIYLYLYLKSISVPYEINTTKEFTISQPVEVNFSKISINAQISRNTVKRAFKELVSLGLLLYDRNLEPHKHNGIKRCMLINDFYLIGFNENRNKIIYSLKTIGENKNAA